ncbi:MAG: DoxX family membrane protein [Candidatus Melainabacteria bacterium]|nr:DoxX family membrane protein [Candidatus Melainabacteria bacterium]
MNLSKISLLLLRLSISYVWLTAGLSKLFNPQFINTFPATIKNLSQSSHFDFYSNYLTQYVLPHSYIFAQLTIWGEILTGVTFLLGFPMVIGTLVGIFMNINYYLVATSVPSQFINIILIFSQFAAYANKAGSLWGLEAKVVKK